MTHSEHDQRAYYENIHPAAALQLLRDEAKTRFGQAEADVLCSDIATQIREELAMRGELSVLSASPSSRERHVALDAQRRQTVTRMVETLFGDHQPQVLPMPLPRKASA